MSAPARLILVRHGESEWNRDHRFTGWADVDLTADGAEQMRDAAQALLGADVVPDIAFTSVLQRCIKSQWLLLDGLERTWIPQYLDWRLNERHYGALTGQAKADAIRRHDDTQVLWWRRSYEAEPPPVDAQAAKFIAIDRRYAALSPDEVPSGESLRQTVVRVDRVYRERIRPELDAGRQVLVMAHGNTLRALIKIVERISDDRIASVEVPNGAPIVYAFEGPANPPSKRVLPVSPRPSSEIL